MKLNKISEKKIDTKKRDKIFKSDAPNLGKKKKEVEKHPDPYPIKYDKKKITYVSFDCLISGIAKSSASGIKTVNATIIQVTKKGIKEIETCLKIKYIGFEVDKRFQFKGLDARKYKPVPSSKSGKVIYYIPIKFMRDIITIDTHYNKNCIANISGEYIFACSGPVKELEGLPIWKLANNSFVTVKMEENRAVNIII